MADIISRLKLESGEFDSKIKRASQELTAYSQHCRKMGLEMGYANKDAKEFAKSLGSMQTTATTARGKVSELSDAFVNLKAMYNQMTDAEKQGQFGKNLAASLDQLKERTQQAKQELADITKELNGASNIGGGGGLFGGGKLDGMLQVFGGNLMTKGLELATGAVSSFASEIGGMITQGVELAKQGEGIRIAFERLGRGDILEGLREATHGTVTDLELMKAAVKFNDFKLPLDELGTMLAFAQQKAKDTGQSVDYMVDSIVTGLGRKSLMILDNLGLSATEVKEKMKQTGDMTKAVGAIIREQMAKAGNYVETAADRAAQANVSLQNKMEELGRKFAPIEEASNQLWTSMKIGILDIVGGPLARLLNGLTEAGRMRNALNDMGGNEQVNSQLGKLRVAKAAGSGYMTRSLYSEQVEQYNRQINAADSYLKQYDSKHSSVNTVLMAASKQFGQKFDSISDLKAFKDAYISTKNEYIKGAQEILNASKPATTTTTPTDTTKTSTKSKTITGEVEAVTGSIDAQTKKVQDLQKAWRAAANDKSREDIKIQIEQAQLVLDAMNGKTKASKITITAETTDALEAVKKIDGVKIDEKSLTITAETTEALAKIQEINGIKIQPKKLEIQVPKIADIAPNGLTGKVRTPEDLQQSAVKMKQAVQLEIDQEASKVDSETLKTLMKDAIQNGIDGMDLQFGMLGEKIGKGIDISDKSWQGIIDQYNALREMIGEEPIVINFETGKINNVVRETEKLKKTIGTTAQVVGTIGQAFNAIEDPAAKVAGTVAQAIANVALAYSDALAKTVGEKFNIWSFIAAAAASTVSMASTIAAIHSQTGYAEGGIVKGNSYSGDNMMFGGDGLYGLNAGELVLTRAQTASVANQLEGSGLRNLRLSAEVKGEQIVLVANRYFRRTGQGEIVTWK